METRQLEIVSTRVAKTLKETFNGRDIFYQYETDDRTPKPLAVNFSTTGEDGKNLGGSYGQNGGFTLNGNGIDQVEDLEILKIAFARILELIHHQN